MAAFMAVVILVLCEGAIAADPSPARGMHRIAYVNVGPAAGNIDNVAAFRESLREPQVIVTDQNADARFWAEALNLGACDFLTRPFDPPEVQRILYNACSRAGSRLSAV